MKIKTVKATWIHVPIPEAEQHTSDFGVIDAFDTTLVLIETESGLVGHGEGRASVFSSGNNAPLVSLINDDIGPALVGENAGDPARLWELMYNGTRAHYALARGRPFPALGRRGLTIAAISAIRAIDPVTSLFLSIERAQQFGGAPANSRRCLRVIGHGLKALPCGRNIALAQGKQAKIFARTVTPRPAVDKRDQPFAQSRRVARTGLHHHR